MIPVLALLVAAAATYALRITFIVFVPADRLPMPVRATLDDVGPAAMAAIVATHLAHGGGPGGLWAPSLVGAGVAAVVAWRMGNLALTVVAGIVAMAVLHTLL